MKRFILMGLMTWVTLCTARDPFFFGKKAKGELLVEAAIHDLSLEVRMYTDGSNSIQVESTKKKPFNLNKLKG